jgi:hypothetical protein
MAMAPWFAILLVTAMTATPAEVEKDGVRIEVSLQSQIYTWTVTNVDAPPITTLRFELYHTYNHHVPAGWEYEDSDAVLRAWTDDPDCAIRRGQSQPFSARVASSGAVLGTTSATVGFASHQAPVTFNAVWGPAPKPRSAIFLVAAMVAAIAIVHVILMAMRDRRRAAPRPTGA